jgi:hypothetical protein
VTQQQVRLLIEAALIVAVAIGAGVAHVGRTGVVAAVAAAWAAIGLVEYRLSRRSRD